MKQIKIISAIAFLSLMLFNSCKKDSQLISASANAKLLNASINYRLLTVPQPANSVLTWNSGYININGITFDGTQIRGNSLHMDQFTSPNIHTSPIFQPINLGNVGVIPSKYNYASFLVGLMSDESNRSLFLYGSYTNSLNQVIPVTLSIDQSIQLSTYWLDNVMIYAGTGYLATLYLDLGVVSQGISSEQLNSAEISGGEILISSVSNTALYSTILNNLALGMNVQFVTQTNLNANTVKDVNAPDLNY